MKVSEVFGSAHLKASDLIVNGTRRRVSATIDAVAVRDFDDNSKKLEITFTGKDKSLICNKTNATAIETLLGDEINLWPGKSITLFPSKVNFQGDMVDCIRVHVPEAAPPPAPVMEDEEEDDIPF